MDGEYLLSCKDEIYLCLKCHNTLRQKSRPPGVTLPPSRGLRGTLHIWGRY